MVSSGNYVGGKKRELFPSIELETSGLARTPHKCLYNLACDSLGPMRSSCYFSSRFVDDWIKHWVITLVFEYYWLEFVEIGGHPSSVIWWWSNLSFEIEFKVFNLNKSKVKTTINALPPRGEQMVPPIFLEFSILVPNLCIGLWHQCRYPNSNSVFF